MKRAAIVIAVCLAALSIAAIRPGEPDPDEPRLITVSGEAQVKVVPDQVIVRIGVQACGASASEARANEQALERKVLAASDELGIDRAKVQTDSLEIDLVKPEYSGWRVCYEGNDVRRYGARQMIRFELDDSSKLSDLLTKTLDAGAIRVIGVDFRTKSLRKYRDQARAMAVKAAREKAEDMARELGQRIGLPRTIAEQPTYGSDWWYYGGGWWWGRDSGGMSQNVVSVAPSAGTGSSDDIALGQIGVTAKVNVSFELKT